jgi:hypothetical protein
MRYDVQHEIRLKHHCLAAVRPLNASPCWCKAAPCSAPIKEASTKASLGRVFTPTRPLAFQSAPSMPPSLPAIGLRSESRSFRNSGSLSRRSNLNGSLRGYRQADRHRATTPEVLQHRCHNSSHWDMRTISRRCSKGHTARSLLNQWSAGWAMSLGGPRLFPPCPLTPWL